MSTTPNMSLILPTPGGDSGTWDDLLDAALTLVDSHDHSIGQGVKVTPAGLNINADLSFGGNAAVSLKAASFATQAAYTVAKSLWVNSADNELYWRTAAGVDVKLTSGTSLNISFVGGIYGDYASTAAKIYYEDAGKRYKMLQSGPAPDFWASVDCGDLKLYEKASGIVNAVTLKSPAALAASYSITMPAALPGSTSVVQMSNAGVLSLTRTPTLDSLTVSGSAGITTTKIADQQEHILMIPCSAGVSHPTAGAATTDGTTWALATGTGNAVMFPVVLSSNDVVVDVVFHLIKATNDTKHVILNFKKMDVISGALTTIATVDNHDNGTGYVAVSLPAVNETLDEAFNYFLTVDGSGTGGDFINGAEVGYKRTNV